MKLYFILLTFMPTLLIQVASHAEAQKIYLTEFNYCMDLRKNIINEKDYYKASTYTHLTDTQKSNLNKAYSINMNYFRDFNCAKILKRKLY